MHSKHTRRYLFAVALLLLLGALVRIHNLGGPSLWMDEAWSVWAAQQPTAADTTRAAVADVHPPFYFLLLKAWVGLAGDSEFAGRMLSLCCGLLTLAFTYRAAFEMFSPCAGWMAVLVAAASSYQVYYARELRMYTLVPMLGAAAIFFYQRWLRAVGRGSALGYWAAITLLLYTHYFGALVPLALLLHYWLVLPEQRRRIPGWLLIHLSAFVAFAPWLPVLLMQVVATPGGLDQATPTNPNTLRYILDVFTDAQPLLYVGLIAVALVSARKPGRRSTPVSLAPLSWAVLVLLWAFVPLGLTLWVNTRFPIFTIQNLTLAAPPVAILAGVGLSRLRARPRAVFAALVVMAGLAVGGTLYQAKPDWRGFVAAIAARYAPGDAMLLHIGGPPLWSMPFEYYYTHALPDASPPVDMFQLQGPPSARVFADALAAERGTGRVWVLFTHTTAVTDYALSLLQRFGSATPCTPVLVASLGDHRAHLYAPAAPDDAASPAAGFYFDDPGNARFHLVGYDAAPGPYRPGDVIDVTLSWEVDAPPAHDYSVGVYLLSENAGPAADHLGFPGGAFTSEWAPGTVYTDPHKVMLPGDLPPGYYNLTVRVVNVFEMDSDPLPVSDPLGVPLGRYAVLGGFVLEAP